MDALTGLWRWWWRRRRCVVALLVVVVVVVVKADTHLEERLMMKKVEAPRKVEMTVEEVEELPVLSLHPREMSLVVGESSTFEVSLSKDPRECINVTFDLSDPVATVLPEAVTLCPPPTPTTTSTPTTTTTATATLFTHTNGLATLTAHASPSDLVWNTSSGTFCLLSVMQSAGLTTTSDVLGWLYTISWDVSFLPQIWHNFRRKSVIGFSFDFLTFNVIGFSSYFVFNMGLYWIDEIQRQYEARHPQSILHVRLNDVIFPLYALVCSFIQVMQCFLYKREEGQRVSLVCRVVSGILLTAVGVGCLLVPLLEGWWWLDLLYLLSYVKLAITCIKYVPQLWVNYSHKSTEGWSIYQVILDFAGGTLSLVQMFLLSANYDNWRSLLTDPAKLGLGLLSIFFNILFFIQHYCLYRDAPSSRNGLKGKEGPLADLDPTHASPITSPTGTADTGLSQGKNGA